MAPELIIGYDSTEQAEDAMALGRLLADALALRITVATVLPTPGRGMSPEEASAKACEGLREVIAERLEGFEAEPVACFDRSPARGLYKLAGERGAALIVVGSTHRGPVGRVLRGSVGDNLLNGAPCAVAVAPRGYAREPERRLLRVGAAFDGGEESRAALATAIGLAGRLRARLSVVAVAEPAPVGYGTTVAVLTAGDWDAFEVEAKQQILDEALASVPDDMPVEGRMRRGPAAPELVEASEELDLLVLGSRGYGPVRRTLLGSTAAAVIDEAHCPVLVLPRGAGTDPLGIAYAQEREQTGSGESASA
jgi:nucleotide-binding universal stress UspA family protein